jgi:ribosome maturation factor RimP
MIEVEHIKALIEQHIEGTGAFLVDVTVKPGNTIRVHLDTPEGISIEECAKVSRFLNEALDRDVEDYSLEVSSPGLSRPFRVKQQYEKNVGHPLEVLSVDGIKVKGILESLSDNGIVLKVGGQQKEIGFNEIKTAKTVIEFK